jgi:hypothetical protein
MFSSLFKEPWPSDTGLCEECCGLGADETFR